MENKRCLHRGENPTNKSCASMGNQLMFLDTIKYFQSLASLANSLTDDEKKNDPKRVLKIYWQRSIVT